MVALCVVGVVVRLVPGRGLWVDEAISVRQAQLPFGEMLDQLRQTDVHPPLHHAALWVTVRIFGTGEVAVRLPSLIAGVALIPVMYLLATALWDRRTGWVAAVLTALSPFCVWYSQEARMYTMFMLFATLAVLGQMMVLRRGRAVDWMLYTAATAAMCWTQYFALLPVAVQQAAFCCVGWRRWRRGDRESVRALARGWLRSAIVLSIVALPLVAFMRDQMVAYGNRTEGLVPSEAGTGSSAVSGTISIYAVIANLIWAGWGYHADDTMLKLAAFWPALMLIALLLLGRGRSAGTTLLVALVIVPMLALFVVGSRKRDLFELRYFSVAVPALLLLLSRFATASARHRVATSAAAAAIVASMLVGLADQQYNGANPRRYDFEGALKLVRERAGPGDVLLYEPVYLADVVAYYAPDLETAPLSEHRSASLGTGGVFVLVTERVVNAEATSARVGTVLAELEQERTVVDEFGRSNVEVWELR